MKTISYFFLAPIFFLSILSCNTNYTVDKKRGYYKIDFPEKQYKLFDQPGYPYSFEYPVYANVIKDTTFFDDKPENEWWLNILFFYQLYSWCYRIKLKQRILLREKNKKLFSLIEIAFNGNFYFHDPVFIRFHYCKFEIAGRNNCVGRGKFSRQLQHEARH